MTLKNAAHARASRGDPATITTTPELNNLDNLPNDGAVTAPHDDAAGGDADRNSVSCVSRRMAMNMMVSASTLAATALATPSIAMASADAELIALGRELDAALVPWSQRVRRGRFELEQFDAAIEQETGLSFDEANRLFDESGAVSHESAPDEVARYFEIRERLARETIPDVTDDLNREYDEIHDRLDPIIEAINARAPISIEGLAVKARAAMVINHDFWDDNSWPELRSLIEDICRMAGIDLVDGILDDDAGNERVSSESRDPIFAEIEAHKRAYAALDDLLTEKSRAESAQAATVGTFKSLKEFDEPADRLLDQEGDAAWEVVATPPTTFAGIAAVLAYQREHLDRGNETFCGNDYVAMFNSTIEQAVCTLAGLPTPDSPQYLERPSSETT